MAKAIVITEKEATAGFLVKNGWILMAIKQYKVGAGLYMPYGGIVEAGETHEECMARELQEESGVHCTLADIEKVGLLICNNFKGTKIYPNGDTCQKWVKVLIAAYLIHNWDGDLVNTPEMKDPRWFPYNALPFERMLPFDRLWVPKVLKGKTIVAEAFYDRDYKPSIQEEPRIILENTRLPRNGRRR